MENTAVVRAAVAQSSFGAAELAARAGLSRATIYRLLNGTVDPRLGDLTELARAAGLALEVTASPLSDPIAAVAARVLLADSARTPDDETQAWIDRLCRYAGDDPVAIVREAGTASAVRHRAGLVPVFSDRATVDRLVSAGRAGNGDWALSGGAAFDAMDRAVAAPTVFWSTDVRATSALLADTFAPTTLENATLLIVPAPDDGSVFDGAVEIEDVRLVSPIQAALDGVGLGDVAQAAALAIVEEWR